MSCPFKKQLGQESQQAKEKVAKQRTQHTANQMLGSIVGLGRRQLTTDPVKQQIGQESQQAKETKANQRTLNMANMMPMLVSWPVSGNQTVVPEQPAVGDSRQQETPAGFFFHRGRTVDPGGSR